MTILFDATRPVKSTRNTFGRGIAPARPARFVPSQADLNWAAQHLNATATDYDVIGPADFIVEEAAREFAMRTAMDNGHPAC